MRFSWARACMALGLCALAACSRDQPLAPGLHSITGHLRLTGYLVDANGQFVGTRVLGDADGVPVELLHGSEVAGRTTTVDGIYSFSGLRPGDYVARSRVIPGIEYQTTPMVIAGFDVSAADTLRLVSRGDLFPVPNPLVDTTQVYFSVPDTMWVDMDIRDLDGNPIKNLISLELAPGRQAVFWNGRDQSGHPVTDSLYWVTYVAGPDIRAHLLFKQRTSPYENVGSKAGSPLGIAPWSMSQAGR